VISEKNLATIEAIKKSDISQYQNLYNLYQMMLIVYESDKTELEYCFKISKFIKEYAPLMHIQTGNADFQKLYYDAILFEARNHNLDSFLIYIEKNRDPEDRYYIPRRRQLISLGLIDAMQKLIDDEIDILSISMPPGTGKTTLGGFFAAAWAGWFPKTCNLFSSHSGHVTRMFYDALQNIIINEEYAWREIFPNVPIESMNAKEETINLGKFKNFKTWTMRAIGASQTGVTRAEGILYCDDLCSGIEEALSKIRLDKLWTKYTADLKSRKKKKCKEIHIATRWSVWDVIGRIQKIYENNKRALFIAVPDIDPVTHESNFDYDYDVGFDVDYFNDIEKSLDDITYKCLYKNEPVEREGILYNTDRLRRYIGNALPDREPDAILAVCDTKDTGTDYNALGVFYQYGTDYYLHDVVFQSIDPYLLDDLNADCLVRNNVQIADFESNKEGSRTADKVQEKVKAKGGRCCIIKKFTTQNKETKIIINSPWVIEHVVFKSSDDYEVKSDYGQFMSWLCAYSQLAKNPHDDAPDMVAMLAVRENTQQGGTAEPCERLW
jgi:predicted phage terminase large subunit-like protein